MARWGIAGDRAVPGDGDGKIDLAVWRPSSGIWYISNSSTNSVTVVAWGVSTDVPVPADYDGDGKADVAVWRPSTGAWYIIRSIDGSIQTEGWGTNGDLPVPSAHVK